jgi:hypothetical protein
MPITPPLGRSDEGPSSSAYSVALRAAPEVLDQERGQLLIVSKLEPRSFFLFARSPLASIYEGADPSP